MKTFHLGLVAALILTLGAATVDRNSVSAQSLSCGPLRSQCASDTQPVCSDNQWRCQPKPSRGTTVRSSSSSDSAAMCGPNNIRCMNGYTPECSAGTWACQLDMDGSSSSNDRCIATCQDGYQYRTCSEDGSPINYFADPCMNHDASSSMSSRSSRSSSSRSSRPSSVHITSLSPATVSVRGTVTIEGTGFARRGNIVLFGDSVIPNVRSLDGKHLTFRVPTRTMRACYFQFSKLMTKCEKPTRTYGSGDYDVSVRVKGDTSNAMTLTLR